MTQKLTWHDAQAIAEALVEQHPDIDPRYIRFTDLHGWICALPNFTDNPEASNERILEAIQMAWIDETD